MKKAVIVLLILSFMGLQLSGCATMSNTEQGALGGAVAGGLLGALVGDTKGAIIGAAAGAIVGAVIGNYYDKQVSSRAEAAKKYEYASKNSGETRIEIEESSFAPERVKTGSSEKVSSSVQYTVLAQSENQEINITETRILVNGKERLELSKREVKRAQGTHVSSMKFEMPKDMEKGDYTLITTITDGRQTKTVKDNLKVV